MAKATRSSRLTTTLSATASLHTSCSVAPEVRRTVCREKMCVAAVTLLLAAQYVITPYTDAVGVQVSSSTLSGYTLSLRKFRLQFPSSPTPASRVCLWCLVKRRIASESPIESSALSAARPER